MKEKCQSFDPIDSCTSELFHNDIDIFHCELWVDQLSKSSLLVFIDTLYVQENKNNVGGLPKKKITVAEWIVGLEI